MKFQLLSLLSVENGTSLAELFGLFGEQCLRCTLPSQASGCSTFNCYEIHSIACEVTEEVGAPYSNEKPGRWQTEQP